MSADDTIRRGARAREILADPLVAELFAGIRADIFEKWRTAPTMAHREELFMLEKGLTAIEAALTGTDAAGRMTEQRLEDERAEAEAERKQRER